MVVYDFEYDGIALSDMGYRLCNFGSNGLATVDNGSKITFNKLSVMNGKKFNLTSTEYQDCLETKLQICKKSCKNDDYEITIEESRKIMRWLNRKQFLKLKMINSEYAPYYFEASFNVSKIVINGIMVGFELQVVTNRSFGLREKEEFSFTSSNSNWFATIEDISDDEGYIYPYTQIEILQDGDLIITNSNENRTTSITNCKKGEIITLDFPIIDTTSNTHKITNDFNWKFLRISNNYYDKENTFTVSIPCTINLSYSPIAKISI